MTQRFGGLILARQTKITDFTRLHQQAGLSFNETIQLIEVSRTTGYRYQAGTGEPSGAARKLLEEAASHRAAKTPGWFTFIDLFAGIGGLRKGFESIGGRCVFTSEWDLKASLWYCACPGKRKSGLFRFSVSTPR
jgi:DNA (cytosine-5)-methyltransferase 1